jgi:hypothetical protein
MTFYVLSLLGFIIIFIIYILNTKKWSHLVYSLLFLFTFSVILLYSLKFRPFSYRGIETSIEEAILFLCMLIGMTTNTLVTRIGSRKEKFYIVDLLKPFSVAPVIFLVVWGAFEKMAEFNFITCCFSYANGYFWESILKTVRQKFGRKVN